MPGAVEKRVSDPLAGFPGPAGSPVFPSDGSHLRGTAGPGLGAHPQTRVFVSWGRAAATGSGKKQEGPSHLAFSRVPSLQHAFHLIHDAVHLLDG
jgi:hypothetical protein